MSVAAQSKAWDSGCLLGWIGFESWWAHGCLSIETVMCCQVDASVSGRSLIQRSPAESVCLFVGKSLSVIRCNNKPVQLQLVG